MTDGDDGAQARKVRQPRGPQQRVQRQVLTAARDLVAADGYTAFTVDALVARSGVSKTTIYRWWDNRAQVALDMMESMYGSPTPASGHGVAAKLRSFAAAEIEYHAGPAGPLLRGLFADSQHRPALRETLNRRYVTPRHQQLESLLHAGIADGELRSDLDVPVAAIMLMAPLFQALLGGAALDNETGLEGRLVSTLLRGIAAN